MKRFSARGLTLIELLLVISLIGIVAIPSVLVFNNFRLKQALSSSTENLAIVLQRAHVFAREEKEGKAWGVRTESSKNYFLVSGEAGDWKKVAGHDVESSVELKTDFFIWFDQGTGETANNYQLILENSRGDKQQVVVNKTGGVTFGEL